MKNMKFRLGLCVVVITLLTGNSTVRAEPKLPQRILIHMKTSLAEDNAQICAVPNVAWAMVNAGHQVTILVDASGVTSVTKGFGWFGRLVHSDTTALDRAKLPERERISLADQMGVPLEKIPHRYGEYLAFLKKMGVTIYGNQTMMLLYNIDLQDVAPEVTPISLKQMVELFHFADRIIVY
jgi:predicted peroxiredoxin